MKKRLFVGVPLPSKFQSIVADYVRKRQQEKFLHSSRLRWTPSKNLHITLCFIGYVEEICLTAITAVLEEITREQKPFSLEYTGISWGPPVVRPRMVWGMFAKSIQVALLSRRLAQSLSKQLTQTAGRPINLMEERPIVPHVTIARFRPISRRSAPVLPTLEVARSQMAVSFLVLYESKLTRKGASYRQLAVFSLSK